jgi:hypothetical protein
MPLAAVRLLALDIELHALLDRLPQVVEILSYRAKRGPAVEQKLHVLPQFSAMKPNQRLQLLRFQDSQLPDVLSMQRSSKSLLGDPRLSSCSARSVARARFTLASETPAALATVSVSRLSPLG